jgi:hypothetical protein
MEPAMIEKEMVDQSTTKYGGFTEQATMHTF